MKYLLLQLAMIFTACGDINIPEEKEDSQLENTENRDKQDENIPQNGTITKTDVAVNVAVSVNQVTVDGPAPEWIYQPQDRDYLAHGTDSPMGYVIPPRHEIMQAHEEGIFDGLIGDTEAFFTGTKRDDEMVYIYDMQTRETVAVPVYTKFPIIYRLDMSAQVEVE